MIPGQAPTIACIGFSYAAKIAAIGVLLFAAGEAVNAFDMWLQTRRDQ